MNKELIYLAIPYTWNPEKSFEIATKVAAQLMEEGKVVFSPVTHSHPISQYIDDNFRLDHDFWMSMDLPILKKCDLLCVIVISDDGFDLIENSRGCKREIDEAGSLGLEINYFIYE
jgi:hypothetical protein